MTRPARATALLAASLASASALATGGAAYANHCDPAAPPAVYRVCTSTYDVTDMRCYHDPETHRVWCEVDG